MSGGYPRTLSSWSSCGGSASGTGISELRYASPGRLLGRVAPDRHLFDVFAFQREASQLLGAEVELFSEAVLNHEHVSRTWQQHASSERPSRHATRATRAT